MLSGSERHYGREGRPPISRPGGDLRDAGAAERAFQPPGCVLPRLLRKTKNQTQLDD